MLGLFYENGWEVEKKIQRSFELYSKASKFDFPYAIQAIGDIYYFGRGGFKKNIEKATKWYKRGAELNYPPSQYSLGLLYKDGTGVKVDKIEAARLIKQSAKEGYAPAAVYLAYLYYSGDGVERDYDKAFEFSEKTANLGFSGAQYLLGLMYYNGLSVKEDKKLAAIWYKKAAEQGNVCAQFDLGVMFAEGDGVDLDKKTAALWLDKAARQDHTCAQIALADIYEKREDRRFDNSIKAIALYIKAAKQGDPWAMFRLSMIYLEGKLVKSDVVEARKWLKLAAEAVEDDSCTINDVAQAYLQRESELYNPSIAVKLLIKAADNGVSDSQYSLGIIYLKGEIVERDTLKAESLLNMAANQNNITAPIALALLYKEGVDEIPKDLAKSIMHLEIAKETGSAAAEEKLKSIMNLTLSSCKS